MNTTGSTTNGVTYVYLVRGAKIKMLTTAQAASRLRSDASTVGKFIRVGLANGTLKLKAKKVNAKHGGKRYLIDPAEVKRFAARRKELGI